MTLVEWVIGLSIGMKLTLGFFAGLFAYGSLRYFVHCANRAYEEGSKHKSNWKENLKTLASD